MISKGDGHPPAGSGASRSGCSPGRLRGASMALRHRHSAQPRPYRHRARPDGRAENEQRRYRPAAASPRPVPGGCARKATPVRAAELRWHRVPGVGEPGGDAAGMGGTGDGESRQWGERGVGRTGGGRTGDGERRGWGEPGREWGGKGMGSTGDRGWGARGMGGSGDREERGWGGAGMGRTGVAPGMGRRGGTARSYRGCSAAKLRCCRAPLPRRRLRLSAALGAVGVRRNFPGADTGGRAGRGGGSRGRGHRDAPSAGHGPTLGMGYPEEPRGVMGESLWNPMGVMGKYSRTPVEFFGRSVPLRGCYGRGTPGPLWGCRGGYICSRVGL